MPPAAVLLVIASLLGHLIIGRWVASPWLMPDVSLVGLLVALQRAPEHRLSLLVLASLGVTAAAAPAGGVAGPAYLGAGALFAWASTQWNLRAPAVHAATLGSIEALLVASWWALSRLPVTLALVGFGISKVVLTVAWGLLLRRYA